MKKVLMLSFRPPLPLTEGVAIRIYNVGKILSTRYQVDLLALNERTCNPGSQLMQKAFNRMVMYPLSPLSSLNRCLRGLFLHAPLQVYYHHSQKAQKWIDEHHSEYDLIFCTHLRMAEYVKSIQGKKVIDLIDAVSMNYKEAKSRLKGLWKLIYMVENRRLLPYELRILDKFDKVFITSIYDRDYLRNQSMSSNEQIIVIPNGVREELLSRASVQKEEDWLVFLGKMSTRPNEDAACYFGREIFPRLHRERPNLKFIIVGKNPTRRVLRLSSEDGVEVRGYVEDPWAYLERAKVVIAPLRFASGIQNKVLEAMALGKPVVATSQVVRGIAGVKGRDFLVADIEDEIILRIRELLQDESRRRDIGKNARELVKAQYRWDLVGERLLQELEELMADSS